MRGVARSRFAGLAGLCLLAAAVTVPSTAELIGETSRAQPFAALPSASLTALRGIDAVMTVSADIPARLLADDEVTASVTDPETAATEDRPLDRETVCMAKVVHHEAANQSREGQLAVAQLILNRIQSGRFAGSVCAVANQPGQFFDTASYSPSRGDSRWATAVAVSREAMSGIVARAVPAGALFYHAASQSPTRFFRGLTRVAQLGDHIFYR